MKRMAMSKSALTVGLGTSLALCLVAAAPSAHADTAHYRYVALDQVPLPAPYTSFSPSTVVEGEVFGTVFDDTFTIANVAVYEKGAITIGASGFAAVANEDGLVGGSNLSGQAALFHGNTTTLVPRLPGEASAAVVGLGNANLSLVSSTNSSFVTTFAYFQKGAETAINFGLPDPVFGAFMNAFGVIGVTKEESQSDPFLHGYRYNPVTKTTTLLPTFAGDPTDINVLIQGINKKAEVLGYSFTDFESPNYHERVGIWGASNVFQPFFEETIVTNLLVFNDRDQIVISNSSDGNSYLVPAPGTRLDLATITDNVPAGLQLAQVVSIDNESNITGFGADATFSNFFPFLLVPCGQGQAGAPVPVSTHSVPWAIAHASDKQHPHK